MSDDAPRGERLALLLYLVLVLLALVTAIGVVLVQAGLQCFDGAGPAGCSDLGQDVITWWSGATWLALVATLLWGARRLQGVQRGSHPAGPAPGRPLVVARGIVLVALVTGSVLLA